MDHAPAPGQGPGPEGFVQFFTTMRAAFPDLSVTVERLVADDDVAFAYTVTHQGDVHGVLATGKPGSVRGMQIWRFENAKMVERWGSSDELGILEQIDGVATVTRVGYRLGRVAARHGRGRTALRPGSSSAVFDETKRMCGESFSGSLLANGLSTEENGGHKDSPDRRSASVSGVPARRSGLNVL